MAGVHIVTDSTASLPRDAATAYGITIVPQIVTIGDERYVGTDPSDERFLAALSTSIGAVTTQFATPDAYRAALREPLGWGVDVVGIFPSAELWHASSTAQTAAAELPAGAPVTLVNVPWVATALGLLVLRAAQAGGDGASREEVCRLVIDTSNRMHLVGLLTDPPRRSRATRASIGGTNTVHSAGRPSIVTLRAGHLTPVGRPTGTADALRSLVTYVASHLPDEGQAHMGVVTAGADGEAAALATYLQTHFQPVEMWIAPCSPVLAVGAGVGAIGVAFYAD